MTATVTDLAQVCAYFTQEMTQALGIESDAILRYGVYDFPVQLYKMKGNTVSVIVDKGSFFQKVVASAEDTSLMLRVKPNGKSAFNSREAVTLVGQLVAVELHSAQSDDEADDLTEIIFLLDNDAWWKVTQAMRVVVNAMASYQGGKLPDRMALRERDVAVHNITLRFSTIELEDGTRIRILPRTFGEKAMSFLVNCSQLKVEDELYISLVLLEYQVAIRLLASVSLIEPAQSSRYQCIEVRFLERPPLAYLIFLDELSKASA